MSKPVIEVKNISKKYRLGSIGLNSFFDDLRCVGKKLGLPCKPPDKTKEFWALRDVSFQVKEGEVLGLIGHNGAGKSTILKILSRITEPTSGSAILRGRAASLLEVGTGFNGEMTGRENIFLNGALYGLTTKEIRKELDSIIDFSQCDEFVDTPVKRYSSGMYVRLAFAVAAHLQPEILIIDEILAVGDMAFQDKCLNKIQEVTQTGRTIIFVSHNIRMINRLCTRGILLENGEIIEDGPMNICVEKYIGKKESKFTTEFAAKNETNRYIQVIAAKLSSNSNLGVGKISITDSIKLSFEIVLNRYHNDLIISVVFKNIESEIVYFSEINDDDNALKPREAGAYKIELNIPNPLLKPGNYSITIGVNSQNLEQLNHRENIMNFEIIDILSNRDNRPGFIYKPINWDVKQL